MASAEMLRHAISPVRGVAQPLAWLEARSSASSVRATIALVRSVREPKDVDRARLAIAGELVPAAARAFETTGEKPFPIDGPGQLLTEHETSRALLTFEAGLIDAYGESEDDAIGSIQALASISRARVLLRENLGLLLLMAGFAASPELDFPHPADLRAIIVDRLFATWAIGPNRTSLRLGSISASPMAAERCSELRWQRSGPHPELLIQPDVRPFMMRLGWNGIDERNSTPRRDEEG